LIEKFLSKIKEEQAEKFLIEMRGHQNVESIQ
jgi:hypothetical protein